MLDLKGILESHASWLAGAGGSRADLRGSDLSSANLSRADLRQADLSSANLSSANLSYANLSDANLRRANLSSANLSYANLSYANLSAFQVVPQAGQFRAYKKVYDSRGVPAVVELLISRSSARTSTLVGRKCRASRVKVLRALNSAEAKFFSMHDPRFVYEVGKWIEVEDYDPDIRVECTRGIHFFLTQEEALAY